MLFSRCLLFCFLAGFKSLYEFDGKLLKKVIFQTVRVHFLKKQKVNFGQLCEVDQCARSTVRGQVCWFQCASSVYWISVRVGQRFGQSQCAGPVCE